MTNNVYDVQAIGVANGTMPANGQVYSLNVNVVAGTPTVFDLKTLTNLMRIENVQGIFIDNSAGTVSFQAGTQTGQNIIVPSGSQALMPLYLSADKVITFNGNGSIPICLLNFPTPASVWNATASQAIVTGGLLQVQDPILESAVVGGYMQAQQIVLGNADVAYHLRSGNPYTGILNSAVTTTIIAGAPSCFVTALDIQLSADATITGGANITVTGKFQNFGNVFSRVINVPATPVLGNGTQIFHMESLDLVGTIAGDSFQIQLSAALTTGSVEYTVIGGTTAVA